MSARERDRRLELVLRVHLLIPTDDPRRAGFTKTGYGNGVVAARPRRGASRSVRRGSRGRGAPP